MLSSNSPSSSRLSTPAPAGRLSPISRSPSPKLASASTFGGRKDDLALLVPARLRQESMFKGLPFDYIMPLINTTFNHEEVETVHEEEEEALLSPTPSQGRKKSTGSARKPSTASLPPIKGMLPSAPALRGVSEPPAFVEDWRDTKPLLAGKAAYQVKTFEDQALFLNLAINTKLKRVTTEAAEKKCFKKHPGFVTNFESYKDFDVALKVMPAGSMAHAIFCFTNSKSTPFLKTLKFGKNEHGTVYSSGHGLLFVPNRSTHSEVITQQNIGLIKFVSYSEQCDVPKNRKFPDEPECSKSLTPAAA